MFTPLRSVAFLLLASFAILLGGCAASKAVANTAWLPDSVGWEVRDVDASEPPQWVLYERDAEMADVKEFRVVGVVDAEPEVLVRALRYRLFDDQYLPGGVQREILSDSETEVVQYGLSSMPFPFNDREATEQTRFTHDPATGVFRVATREIDPGGTPPGGVVRVPVIRNTYVIAPSGPGKSVITNDSVHDIGGNFPNSLINPLLCKQMIADLSTLEELAATEGEWR